MSNASSSSPPKSTVVDPSPAHVRSDVPSSLYRKSWKSDLPAVFVDPPTTLRCPDAFPRQFPLPTVPSP